MNRLMSGLKMVLLSLPVLLGMGHFFSAAHAQTVTIQSYPVGGYYWDTLVSPVLLQGWPGSSTFWTPGLMPVLPPQPVQVRPGGPTYFRVPELGSGFMSLYPGDFLGCP